MRYPSRLAVGLLLCFSMTASAQMTALETDNLRLIYVDPTQTYVVPYTAQCFENSMQFLRELAGYTSPERVNVLLLDFSDQGNASAGYLPRNMLLVQTAPSSVAYETDSANERMNALMNHELFHIVATDQSTGTDRAFRKFFGGKVAPSADNPETILYSYLTLPRGSAPRWYSEGIAVFVETWMGGGHGRAQGSYDEMVFRSMVRDGSHFYDPLGLVSEGIKIDFQVGANSYLYGTRFISYLALKYSPESLIKWVARTEGSKKYYSSQFKQVFGLPLAEAWSDWIAWEHEFQQANLDTIRKYPITPHEDLSSRALGSVSRPYFDPDTQKIYAALNYPGVVSHVGAISVEDGSVERIIDIKGPLIYEVASITYDPDAKKIYYTTDNSEHRDLREVDPATKKSRTLLKDARIGDLVFNPADRSIWGVRHFNGIATVVRVPHPYEEWNQIHSWPYGEVIYNLDLSPDGRLLSASVGEINGQHTLRVMNVDRLIAGDVTPVAQVDFGTSIPLNFVFSKDGKSVVGSSYYTGASNIFRYEIATETLDAVSNAETGFFRPIPMDDDSLIVFRYTGDGFVPATIEAKSLEDINAIDFLGQRIVERHPVVKDWSVGSPADIPLDSLVTNQATYKSFKSLGLESAYPVVEGYKDSFAYGYRVNVSDPIAINRFSLTASYSPDDDLESDEKTHVELEYDRYNWRAGFKYNDADFYDLFGPTKTSRKGYSVSLGYTKNLILDNPRKLTLTADAEFHGDLETLPNFQNIGATEDKLTTGSVSLSYVNPRFSLGAVDWEKGLQAQAHFFPSYVDSEFIPAFIGSFDYGFALPLRHSSIWLRNSVGAAFGDLEDPFANFYFGGFGNNYVDHRSVKRYREFHTFPGFEINEVGGRNYAKTMVEWNLPPFRFKRVGTPGFYVSWARTSLFATGLKTNLDESSADRRVANAGAQVDFRMTALSRLNLTFSLGYALAFEHGNTEDEFFYSLKILQ